MLFYIHYISIGIVILLSAGGGGGAFKGSLGGGVPPRLLNPDPV